MYLSAIARTSGPVKRRVFSRPAERLSASHVVSSCSQSTSVGLDGLLIHLVAPAICSAVGSVHAEHACVSVAERPVARWVRISFSSEKMRSALQKRLPRLRKRGWAEARSAFRLSPKVTFEVLSL